MTSAKRLIESLRTASAPDGLFPLAETALASMSNAPNPGSLLVVHVTILVIASSLDGEPLSEDDWSAVKRIFARLADLLENDGTDALDRLGKEWRDWKRPTALH